jgi:hypothetical protein
MSENIIQNEFNVSALFSQLYKAKKIAIFTVFIFALLAGLFAMQMKPTYESSALMELGSYNSKYNERELIESSKSFMSNFKINLFYKNELNISENVSVSPIEKSLIKFTIYSDSDKKNLLVIDKLLSYTQTRHNKMFDQINQDQINKLASEIETIENEINFLNRQFQEKIYRIDNEINFLNRQFQEQIDIKKLDYLNEIDLIDMEIQYLEEVLRISNQEEIINLNIAIPTINKQIQFLKEIIIEDEANLNLLQSNPKYLVERNITSPTLSQVIFSYKEGLSNYENDKKIKEQRLKSLENVRKTPEIFELNDKKRSLENQIELLENTVRSEKIFELQEEKKNLENQINLLKNSGLSLKIFELNEKIKGLESEIKFNENRVLENSILISEIQTFSSRKNSIIIIIFGLILGFFASILYVLISNYLSLGKSKST